MNLLDSYCAGLAEAVGPSLTAEDFASAAQDHRFPSSSFPECQNPEQLSAQWLALAKEDKLAVFMCNGKLMIFATNDVFTGIHAAEALNEKMAVLGATIRDWSFAAEKVTDVICGMGANLRPSEVLYRWLKVCRAGGLTAVLEEGKLVVSMIDMTTGLKRGFTWK
ncbi:hypothetical protein ACYPKM_04985 [Pseudomonas aeruginosa]